MSRYFDPAVWQAVPYHFWSAVFFAFGATVGSFLNVCIHRMPRGESLISPPSHCPHCRYSIPWYLNVPLLTWLMLRGRCAHCRAPISPRYVVVEFLTGLAFLGCWLLAGRQSAWLALVYCLLVGGLIVATFIDFEHFIIPDEITLGGTVAGLLCSIAVPGLHGQRGIWPALGLSVLGAAVGAGVVYAVLRGGKLFFGRQQIELEPETRIVFTETALVLPDQEIPFEELFYRKTDYIEFEARSVEMIDRCFGATQVRLTPEALKIGGETFHPEQVSHLEAVTDRIVLPREAMGLGDVKFMGAIGAFLGWQGAMFSLLASSVIGAVVGVGLIALRKQEWSSKLPFGPYIALAAVIWMSGGARLLTWWMDLSARWLGVGP